MIWEHNLVQTDAGLQRLSPGDTRIDGLNCTVKDPKTYSDFAALELACGLTAVTSVSTEIRTKRGWVQVQDLCGLDEVELTWPYNRTEEEPQQDVWKLAETWRNRKHEPWYQDLPAHALEKARTITDSNGHFTEWILSLPAKSMWDLVQAMWEYRPRFDGVNEHLLVPWGLKASWWSRFFQKQVLLLMLRSLEFEIEVVHDHTFWEVREENRNQHYWRIKKSRRPEEVSWGRTVSGFRHPNSTTREPHWGSVKNVEVSKNFPSYRFPNKIVGYSPPCPVMEVGGMHMRFPWCL